MIACLVPDIPESVEVKVKRERYLAKEALAENKVRVAAFPCLSCLFPGTCRAFCECSSSLSP